MGGLRDARYLGRAAQEQLSLMNDLDDHDRTKVSLEVAVITNCKWSVVRCQDLPDSRAGLREGRASPDREWQYLQDRLQTINSELKPFALSLACLIHPSHRRSQSIAVYGTDLDRDTPLRPSRARLSLAREASAELQ